LLSGALLLAAAVGSAGCKEKAVAAAASEDAAQSGPRVVKFDPGALERLGVKVAVVGESAARATLDVPGSLEYDLEHYAEIGVVTEGRVQSVNVRVGDAVKKGQTLATVLVPSVAEAQANFLSAQAAERVAREHAEREAKLLEKELTTAHEEEVAREDFVRSQAALKAAEARLRVLGVSLPSSEQAIRGAGTLMLTSPIDGVVVRRDAVLGRFLQPDEKAFAVADPSRLWATVEVYEYDLPYFHVGSEVEISIDAMPGVVVKGKVAVIEPQIGSASRAVRARIAVDNSQGLLRPGFFVRASVAIPNALGKNRSLVAPGAVQPIGDEDVVFVERSPGLFEVRPVRIARRTPQVIEIAEGLSNGERIAVEGGFLLRGEVTKQ
jgi:cobalt-zinc-cadmium efflux system membrane fusion protein